MYDITFIGYGIATMCALLALDTHSLKIAVIDPFFDGGSLHRHYATIQSNTTWQQFLDAVSPFILVTANPDTFAHLIPPATVLSATNTKLLFPTPNFNKVEPAPTSKSPEEYAEYPVPP